MKKVSKLSQETKVAKPIREAAKVPLVNLVEDGRDCVLDDLVFQ